MDLWSRSGFAGQAARAAATSASGRCLRWAASRGPTSKAWPSSTGRTTAPGSRTTHPAPETRCSCQTAACDRRAGPSSLRLPGSTVTFRLWAPDGAFIYFVQGELPDKLDIWRIRPAGGTPERITSHNGRVSYPVLLDRRTLMYLASDPDGSGPWLYSMDVERRIPHRLTSGLDRYTSLAASADGRRLVVTLASSAENALALARSMILPAEVSAPAQISLTTSTGFSPRLGPNYLLYVSATGTGESIWKLANGTGHGVVEWSGSASLWRPGNLPRWTVHRILGPATRANALVRDAGRRHERARSWLIRSICRALQHGRPTANRSPRRPTITASHTSSACPSTVARPLLLSGSIRSILRGRPTAASLSTRDPISAPHFL